MRDELKEHLKGWPQGEEILDYIESLEREYELQRKEYYKLEKNIDMAVPILEGIYKNFNALPLDGILARLDHAIRWLRSN